MSITVRFAVSGIFIVGIFVQGFSQENIGPDLITNGNFEKGNKFFTSDYLYREEDILPGSIVITSDASAVEEDLKNPVEGDHTSGSGKFLIVNAGSSGKKFWRYKVNVKPNSVYRLSLYFMNVYKHQGSNGFMINGFAIGYHPKNNFVKVRAYINGKQLGEEQTDMFHKWRWVYASWEWYSGTSNGPVEISLDNPNPAVLGNDLAVDDIEFVLIETKPRGYKPPERKTVMLPENTPAADNRIRLVTTPTDKPGEFYVGDTLGDGIYKVGKRKPYNFRKPEIVSRNINVENLMFEKGKPELQSDSYAELEKLANHMLTFSDVKVRLEGHTDNLGDSLINLKLSEERVFKVKKLLIEKGIDAGRIEVIGFGGSRPLTENTDEEKRKLNRRVEVILY
jgi:outer membrane protein OmpA-like peptidoglycan-associated protein